MTQYTLGGETYEQLACGQCGMTFYVPYLWVYDRRDKGEYGREFCCPNGHSRVWAESTLDKVRRERDRLKQQTAQLQDEARRERERADREAARSARVVKRARAALCPCCNRSFVQIARHMKTKHPEVVQLPVKEKLHG